MIRRSAILLVEDNEDDVFLFKRALRDGGHDYEVHVAGSGQEAIDYLQLVVHGGEKHPAPRFIILDTKMPMVNGNQFLRWITSHPLCRVIPTVILSGADERSEVQAAFDLGAHGYFVKPSSPGELADLMKMIFQYWARSKVPPVKEYEVTEQGEQPLLKATADSLGRRPQQLSIPDPKCTP